MIQLMRYMRHVSVVCQNRA